MPVPPKLNISSAFNTFTDHWSPRIAAELNHQHVKLVKILGEFDWHFHEHEDELFLVHAGSFTMEFRDSPHGPVTKVELTQGDLIVVPKGQEHRPVAARECEVILFEPATTLNTGNTTTARTVLNPRHLAREPPQTPAFSLPTPPLSPDSQAPGTP